jgi:hypothetical protein
MLFLRNFDAVVMILSCFCHDDVMLWSCCGHVLVMFPWCFHATTMMLPCCCNAFVMMLSCPCHSLVMLFSWCFHDGIMQLTCCCHSVTIHLSSCFHPDASGQGWLGLGTVENHVNRLWYPLFQCQLVMSAAHGLSVFLGVRGWTFPKLSSIFRIHAASLSWWKISPILALASVDTNAFKSFR